MTTPSSNQLHTLRDRRPLLLACEAIGWLHMAGKAKADFLRGHGGQPNNNYGYEKWFNFENPPFPWSNLLQWVQNRYPLTGNAWPSSLTDFVSKHTGRNPGLLGLLQAGHGMASGIEKNIPASTSRYLGQDVTHMWLTTAFGHPVRNLLQDPPEVLTDQGWQRLVEEIKSLLEELRNLGQNNTGDVDPWWRWREGAIGAGSCLRKAFLSTLAETRVPNNDVTLWDQSYVAAALFKSAVAGAALVPNFPWNNQGLKQATRWRVLTVGFGTGHYEARAVKIGDWTGAHRDKEGFFEEVRKFIEVEIAVGNLVYRDDETLVFTFPGLSEDGKVGLDDTLAEQLRQGIEQEIANLAQNRSFETPPLCLLSASTRSFVGMVNELRKARSALAIPLHKGWSIPTPPGPTGHTSRHVCPVCQVRLNEPKPGDRTDNARKSRLCGVCEGRRRGRLDAWLQSAEETIWIDEVADENDRLALLTLSLEIEPWLAGERVDSLRAQSIAEWRRSNPVLESKNNRIDNPINLSSPFESLRNYIEQKLPQHLDKNDLVVSSIQEGYRDENNWENFFRKIVEDRADAPAWNGLNDEQRARWLTHQFFRKLPSPGRVYRFWRDAETFFQEFLLSFGEIVSAHLNRWRVRRLALTPQGGGAWDDRETYTTRWRDAPLELLWLQDKGYFVTISNLARGLNAQESKAALQNQSLEIFDENGHSHRMTVQRVDEPDRLGVYRPLVPLELSPRRFRVLVPLDRATACLEAAIAKWQKEFARVWDRLPLRIGVVAFPRMTPFQAVIEATRHLEARLDEPDKPEIWKVEEAKTWNGITALCLERPEGGHECRLVPVRLPDGRADVFYPYAMVEDRTLRFPHDFQHPDGQVYRRMSDLRRGDGICVWPGRIAALFLDTTARRFAQPRIWPLAEISRMREIWRLVCRTAPGMAALQGAWAELARQQTQWTDPDGTWLAGAEAQWLSLARAVLADRWQASGAALDTLVEAAKDGVLEWAIEWHLTWLKEKVEERP